MSKATKRRKDKLQDLADEQMLLPSLDYFVGRERGMHEMANYARPRIEKLLLNQRKQAVEAITKATSDIQDKYNEAIKESRKKIAVDTTGVFLQALKFRHDDDINKVRGLKNGILIRNRDTGQPMHVLPNQYLLYRGETDCYFPENMETEKKTQSILGSSFIGAIAHREALLKGEYDPDLAYNPNPQLFPTYMGKSGKLPTGELEGVFEGKPVLLSRFEGLPTKGIIEDMIMKMEANQPVSTLPSLTFFDADLMVSDVTEGDIEDAFRLS
jgi:hypothetical protein